jgi:hypothetical protein
MLAYSERLPSGEKWEMHTRSEKEEEFIYFFRQTHTQNKIEKKRREIPRKQHLKT